MKFKILCLVTVLLCIIGDDLVNAKSTEVQEDKGLKSEDVKVADETLFGM